MTGDPQAREETSYDCQNGCAIALAYSHGSQVAGTTAAEARHPEGPAPAGEAGDAMDAGGFNGFVQGHIRRMVVRRRTSTDVPALGGRRSRT
jgi:hypothetical protein